MPRRSIIARILKDIATVLDERGTKYLGEKIEKSAIQIERLIQKFPKNEKTAQASASLIMKVLSILPLDYREKIYTLATKEDSEYIRQRVFELLPEGWKKVDKKRSRGRT